MGPLIRYAVNGGAEMALEAGAWMVGAAVSAFGVRLWRSSRGGV